MEISQRLHVHDQPKRLSYRGREAEMKADGLPEDVLVNSMRDPASTLTLRDVAALAFEANQVGHENLTGYRGEHGKFDFYPSSDRGGIRMVRLQDGERVEMKVTPYTASQHVELTMSKEEMRDGLGYLTTQTLTGFCSNRDPEHKVFDIQETFEETVYLRSLGDGSSWNIADDRR